MPGAPKWWQVGYFVMAAILIASSLVSMVFLWWFRNKPIVAMSQPTMLSIMSFGGMMIGISLVFWELPTLYGSEYQSSETMIAAFCIIHEWLYNLGYIVMTTILLCKLYRAYKVTRFRRGQKTPRYIIFGPFALGVLASVGALVVIEILYPPVTSPGKFLDFYVCGNPSWGYFITYTLLLFFILIINIGILVFAWKLRHVNEEIGDSKRILWLSTFTTPLFLVSYLTITGINLSSLEFLRMFQSRYAVWITCTFLGVLATIGFLVGPRMYYVWYERVHGRLPEGVVLLGTGRVHVNVNAGMEATPPAAETDSIEA